MKVSLNWLSDYVQTGLSADRIAEILSDLGFPCEGIEYLDGDTVIDVEVTSNRGDCLGYIGIARELAAATGSELKIPAVRLDESKKQAADLVRVEIAEPHLCGRYTARIIEGVKVGPSPDWLRTRLEAVGLRSVSNVVDAANYAMMETGQPPHAFDYEKIADGKIVVRKALAGECIVSIDGSKCQLDADMLIIADADRPVAIAGVMGGLHTEVSETTKTILLEDAYFDPVTVRTTSRRLALPSEAAFRFERIVDIEMIDRASMRTAQLITQVAGGKVAKGVVDVYPQKPAPREVPLRLSRLSKLLGIEIPPQEVVRILSALSFQPRHKDDLVLCSVPSWRSDVYREADLIEEVARVYGYNKIPTERRIRIEVVPVDARQKLAESIGTYLNGCGFYEVITTSFQSAELAELVTGRGAESHLVVQDISRKTENLLRSSLVGSLLNVVRHNYDVGNKNIRIYEIANVFERLKDGSHTEHTSLSLVCALDELVKDDRDFRILKGVVEGLIRAIARDANIDFKPEIKSRELRREKGHLCIIIPYSEILVNGESVGSAGVLSYRVVGVLDIKADRVCSAELDFDKLLELYSTQVKMKPIPKFPAIERDLSIIVAESASWADIVEAVHRKAPGEMEDIQFVEIYRGKAVPSGKKSVTLSLRFRDEDGTLTHEAVDRFQADIVESLAKHVGAELRTV
jgi:phenylalanyl-tRNA synthetase beta chain